MILFPVGPVTLLSGNTVSLGVGLLRLLYVTLYVAAAMAALGAIGLAISTLTEHPIGAIAAVLVLAVASEVADSVAQFAVIHPYLPTHFWLSFDSLLRTPIDTGSLLHGLLSFAVYIGDLLLDRLGPVHQRRRHQLSRGPAGACRAQLVGQRRASWDVQPGDVRVGDPLQLLDQRAQRVAVRGHQHALPGAQVRDDRVVPVRQQPGRHVLQ